MDGSAMKTAVLVAVLMIVTTVCCPAEAAERLAVTGEVANVRSGPGPDYSVMWQVQQYHPVEVVQKEGNWCRFRDFEGDEGWIHDSLLGNVEAVITRKPECNVRKGPGTQYDIAFTVSAGVPFKVLDRQGSWIRVVHADGDGGWVHRSLVW
jgi:SH3-like domain-containing protein